MSAGASEPGGHGRILPILFLGVLMGALDVAIVGPALPAIGRTFNIDARSLAWVFTMYVLFNLIGAPLIARLSDLYGRRILYAVGVGVFGAGSLVVALAGSLPVLLAGRAVQGFGAGGIFPVASAVIGDAFPPERRGRALGLLGMVFGLAFLLGPILGGILLRYGWRWLFLINLPVAVVVIVQALRLLPDTRRGGVLRLDLAGMALLSVSLVLLALGISAIDAANVGGSLASVRVWPLLAGAALLLILFWRQEKSAEGPLIDPIVLRERQLRIANYLAATAGMIEAGLVFVPSLIITAFGVEPATASLMLLPAVAAAAVGAPLTGQLLDRYGSRVVVLTGSLILGLSLLAVRWLTADLPLFLAGEVAVGLGLASLVGAPLQYIVLNAAGVEYRGAAQAVVNLFRGVGRLVGATLVGAIVASHAATLGGYHSGFAALSIFVMAGAASALGLRGREAERALAE